MDCNNAPGRPSPGWVAAPYDTRSSCAIPSWIACLTFVSQPPRCSCRMPEACQSPPECGDFVSIKKLPVDDTSPYVAHQDSASSRPSRCTILYHFPCDIYGESFGGMRRRCHAQLGPELAQPGSRGAPECLEHLIDFLDDQRRHSGVAREQKQFQSKPPGFSRDH